MRIAVFGSGGVGGYFGGRLAQAGEDVVFLARGDHLKAMKTHGLKVDSVEGDFTVNSVDVTDDPAKAGIADVILVCVKAWQVPEAAEAMKPMVGPKTFVVPLQNGIEAPSQLADVLGAEHVLGGLCGLFTFIEGPGHIKHAGSSPFVKFGELDNKPSKRTEELQDTFSRASGVTAEIPGDILAAIWTKFMFIVSWSGVGSITRAPIGVIRSQPGTRRMLEQVMDEVYSLAQARDIALTQETITGNMDMLDGVPENGTASMQRDIMAGRLSELESQNGAVVRLGLESGVETPVNTMIYNSLLPVELRSRGKLTFDI